MHDLQEFRLAALSELLWPSAPVAGALDLHLLGKPTDYSYGTLGSVGCRLQNEVKRPGVQQVGRASNSSRWVATNCAKLLGVLPVKFAIVRVTGGVPVNRDSMWSKSIARIRPGL